VLSLQCRVTTIAPHVGNILVGGTVSGVTAHAITSITPTPVTIVEFQGFASGRFSQGAVPEEVAEVLFSLVVLVGSPLMGSPMIVAFHVSG